MVSVYLFNHVLEIKVIEQLVVILEEQRRMMAEAETLHQEAHETYHQMLRESMRLSQEDYYQQRRDVTNKPAQEE